MKRIGKIYIGADHAGFTLKEKLKKWLTSEGFTVVDKGNTKMNMQDDYPDYGAKVAQAVQKGPSKGTWIQQAKGILVCGSSQGVAITANKFKGIRAVTPNTISEAQKTREHNNANVICLSGWKQTPDKAQKLILAWLETGFSAEPRHARRVKKISIIEEKVCK